MVTAIRFATSLLAKIVCSGFKVVLGLTAMSAILMGTAAPGFAAPVVSTFDASNDGWNISGSDVGVYTWESAGGNPDGYIRYDVTQDGAGGWISAPSQFLGNWSNLDGVGTLSYDHQIFNLGAAVFLVNVGAIIVGADGSSAQQIITLDPPVVGSWETFSMSILEADWVITTGNWSSLLANVSSLSLKIEAVGNNDQPGDIDGIDNVFLSDTPLSAVPVPATVWLFGSGLLGLVGMARRKKA